MIHGKVGYRRPATDLQVSILPGVQLGNLHLQPRGGEHQVILVMRVRVVIHQSDIHLAKSAVRNHLDARLRKRQFRVRSRVPYLFPVYKPRYVRNWACGRGGAIRLQTLADHVYAPLERNLRIAGLWN